MMIVNRKMAIFVTGSSGFIGFHLSKKLLSNNEIVIGLDNMNGYYDMKLKSYRFTLHNIIRYLINKNDQKH